MPQIKSPEAKWQALIIPVADCISNCTIDQDHIWSCFDFDVASWNIKTPKYHNQTFPKATFVLLFLWFLIFYQGWDLCICDCKMFNKPFREEEADLCLYLLMHRSSRLRYFETRWSLIANVSKNEFNSLHKLINFHTFNANQMGNGQSNIVMWCDIIIVG